MGARFWKDVAVASSKTQKNPTVSHGSAIFESAKSEVLRMSRTGARCLRIRARRIRVQVPIARLIEKGKEQLLKNTTS